MRTANDTEQAIDEALGGDPRADELAEMISALEVRRETFQRELDGASGEAGRKEWTQRLREVQKQIDLLKEEQAINRFVENSVRVAATRPRFDMDDEEY